jgi:hypothetical protein
VFLNWGWGIGDWRRALMQLYFDTAVPRYYFSHRQSWLSSPGYRPWPFYCSRTTPCVTHPRCCAKATEISRQANWKGASYVNSLNGLRSHGRHEGCTTWEDQFRRVYREKQASSLPSEDTESEDLIKQCIVSAKRRLVPDKCSKTSCLPSTVGPGRCPGFLGRN